MTRSRKSQENTTPQPRQHMAGLFFELFAPEIYKSVWPLAAMLLRAAIFFQGPRYPNALRTSAAKLSFDRGDFAWPNAIPLGQHW
jgi:hypothetical protein